MSTLNNISQAEQRITKSQRADALKKLKECKLDTRRKIEWGGLVVKSMMSQYSKEVVLGALMISFEKIEQSPGSMRLYQSRGEKAFIADK